MLLRNVPGSELLLVLSMYAPSETLLYQGTPLVSVYKPTSVNLSTLAHRHPLYILQAVSYCCELVMVQFSCCKYQWM